jgi:hypothetical protein
MNGLYPIKFKEIASPFEKPAVAQCKISGTYFPVSFY